MVELVIGDKLWEISKAVLCKMYNDASDKSVDVSESNHLVTLVWRGFGTFPSAECSLQKNRQRDGVLARHRFFCHVLSGHQVLYVLVGSLFVLYCRLCFRSRGRFICLIVDECSQVWKQTRWWNSPVVSRAWRSTL